MVALDRNRDPLRHVPAPRQHAADQGVVDSELVAFFADALLGGAPGGVEVGAPAGVKLGDDEAADVVQQRRDDQLVALGPADLAADPVRRLLRRQRVHAELLRAQLPAAVGLEEVEDGRGAGDRQHARGLEHVDRRRARRRSRRTTLERLAKRSTAIVSATSASTASTSSPTRAVSAVAACITRARDSISAGNFSTASKAAARRAPGAAASRPRAPSALAGLAPLVLVRSRLPWSGVAPLALIGSEGRTV